MLRKTTHYELSKPDYNETADIEVVNSNMDIIDGALHELKEDINDIYKIVNQDISSYADNLNTNWTKNYFVGVNYKEYQSAFIKTISFVSKTSGLFDLILFDVPDINEISSQTKKTVLKTLEVNTSGLNKYQIDIYVPSDKILAFRTTTGSACYSQTDYEASTQYFYMVDISNACNIIFSSGGTLGIGLEYFKANDFIVDIYKRINNLFPVKEYKTYSILGDSVSTYKNYITNGNVAYYPQSWFTGGVEATWWKLVEKAKMLSLNTNNSYSGSYVSNYEGNNSVSMTKRCENLGENPDIIFFFGGFNDFQSKISLGTVTKQNDYSDADLSVFSNAYCYILQKITSKYPTADIYCLGIPPEFVSTNWAGQFDEYNGSYYKSDMNEIIKKACEIFHVHYIDASSAYTLKGLSVYAGDWDGTTGLHPNENGMKRIADCVIHDMVN